MALDVGEPRLPALPQAEQLALVREPGLHVRAGAETPHVVVVSVAVVAVVSIIIPPRAVVLVHARVVGRFFVGARADAAVRERRDVRGRHEVDVLVALVLHALTIVLAPALAAPPVDRLDDVRAVRVHALVPARLGAHRRADARVELRGAPARARLPGRRGGLAVAAVVVVTGQIAAVHLVRAVAVPVADPGVGAILAVARAVRHRAVGAALRVVRAGAGAVAVLVVEHVAAVALQAVLGSRAVAGDAVLGAVRVVRGRVHGDARAAGPAVERRCRRPPPPSRGNSATASAVARHPSG